ncbi:MAG: hypothetical protein M1834_005587 [Cirrosporium novae-zelandiae]|nr:MAG: hypothetical protein M1834_005587 [Cirrosporium novae-zelandiae]
MKYHDCFDGLQCARLEVPMDYNRTDGKGRTVAVALTRLPAKVPVTDPRYGGPILINPGGPGGSGVSQLLYIGREIQTIVDSSIDPNSKSADDSDPKYFDIIGFDPRGINNTTPVLSCFPDSFSRQNWGLAAEAVGILGSSEDSFTRNWYRSRAVADGCSQATGTSNDGEEVIGQHMNTSPVAADMVQIIERHAEWREKQGKSEQEAQDSRHSYEKAQSIATRTRWDKGNEKLQYWGFSYGSVLGTTFSAMYPDKVKRVILDGVCDSEDYYNGDWFTNLVDADHILDRFVLYCEAVGPKGCRFYKSGGGLAIREAYEDVLSKIYKNPISVPASTERGPEIITWTDVKLMVKTAMYQPLRFFPLMASLLSDVASGNGTMFAGLKQERRHPTCPSLECQAKGPYSSECSTPGESQNEATLGVLCTDAEGLGQIDEEGFTTYWHALQQQSKTIGDYWAHTRLSCIGWKTKAKWRFHGPFTGNTSHPLLWIGNTLDPVTPLRNAQKMSLSFPGSVVLQQESEGHTSLTAPSLCTAKAIRAYFQTGQLPARGTICEADVKPLLGAVPSFGEKKMLRGDERTLLEAVEKAVGNFRIVGGLV